MQPLLIIFKHLCIKCNWQSICQLSIAVNKIHLSNTGFVNEMKLLIMQPRPPSRHSLPKYGLSKKKNDGQNSTPEKHGDG